MNWIKSLTFCAVMLTAAVLLGDDAADQLNAAKTTFTNKQFDSARAGFENFLQRFPTHVQANEAKFYLAESYMYLGQYPQAETYFNQLVALGLNDQFARAALFRLAEIPYLQGQFQIAKPRLEDFVGKLPQDANLQFVLYYLGDIAMRSNVAVEAEWYFDQAVLMYPEGVKWVESQLGLAWAKNKLDKINEANGIYWQLMSSTNPAVVEQATYQYGTALFERGAYQESINLLTDFQARYPASSYFADSLRVVARCKGRLNDFEGALQVLARIPQPTPDDLLMKVRCLYGLKRMQEAKTALDDAKRVAGTTYRDEIALLESVFLSDQQDWRGAIDLLEQVLVPQFDTNNNRMIVNYFSLPLAAGMKKLSDEAIFRACSLLTLAYARSGDSAKSNALLHEMQTQAALLGNVRLTSICTDTANQLANLGNVPNQNGSRPGGGSFANRGNEQWKPSSGQGLTSRPMAPLTQGSDLDKFWRAEQLYRAKNYEGTVQQLEQLLSGFYNEIAVPPLYSIHYNVTGAEGALDELTFARACSLLTLSKGQLGDLEQANAVLMTLGTRISRNDPRQDSLLRDTYDQLAVLVKGGTGTAPAPLLSDTEQRRLLREANSHFRRQEYKLADEKLAELVAANPPEAICAEALLLQGKAKYKLGWDQEGVAILERIIDEFSKSKEYPEALWYLGLYYESGGDTFQSSEYFQMLVDKFPNFVNVDGAKYFLAVEDLTNGNGRKANMYLTQVYRNHRNGLYWSHAAWTLAYEAYKKKQYDDSERYIQEILRHPPDAAILDRVLYLRGELALRKDDFESAFWAFKAVRDLVRDSPLAYHAEQNARLAASKTTNVN